MDQAETSIPDQKTVNHHYAVDHGLIHHADFESKGVSGSRSVNRRDIDEIIEAKRRGDFFSVVLVHDLSRLTRAGIVRGHELRRRLARAGILLLSAGDNLPEAEDERDLMESVIHYQNHKFSKGISETESRGNASSFLEGRRAAPAWTPYGYDRLYLTADQKPILLLRILAGGIRHLLDPTTLKIHRVLVSEKGQTNKFLKQRSDISRLVPGCPEHVKVVQQIWRWYYVDGFGAKLIAGMLNRQSVPPPRAALWNTTTITCIIRNEQYLGRSVLCRRAAGWFHVLAEGRPMRVQTDSARLEELGYEHKPVTRRSHDEWLVPKEHVPPVEPLIVDPVVRAVAEPLLTEWWHLWETHSNRGTINKTKHHHSKYFLKTVLRSKQGNYPLRGHTNRKWRYYTIGNLQAGLVKPPLSNSIAAGPAEEAVLSTVSEVLKCHDKLGDLIVRHIAKAQSDASHPAAELAKHQMAATKLKKRIDLFYRTADVEGDEKAFTDTVSEMKLQLRQEEAAIRALQHSDTVESVDPDAVKESVLRQLQDIHKHLDDFSVESIAATCGGAVPERDCGHGDKGIDGECLPA